MPMIKMLRPTTDSIDGQVRLVICTKKDLVHLLLGAAVPSMLLVCVQPTYEA